MGSVRQQVQPGFVGFGSRFAAHIVDILFIAIPAVVLYNLSLRLSVKAEAVYPFAAYWLLLYGYYTFMYMRYGGTPGKLLNKMRVVDKNGRYLMLSRAVARSSIFIAYSLIVIFIIKEGLDLQLSRHELSRYITTSGGALAVLRVLLSVVCLVDGVVVLVNRRKRALHDRIAGSYVVTYLAYERLKAGEQTIGELETGGQDRPVRERNWLGAAWFDRLPGAGCASSLDLQPCRVTQYPKKSPSAHGSGDSIRFIRLAPASQQVCTGR